MVHGAVVALRPVVQRATSGLGVLGLPARMFTGKLIRYIDECCLAHVFLRPDLELPESIKMAVGSYVRNGRAMTRQAAVVTLNVLVVSLIFYALFGLILFSSILSGNVTMIIVATFFILFLDAYRKCAIDSYVMTVMVATFIGEVTSSKD